MAAVKDGASDLAPKVRINISIDENIAREMRGEAVKRYNNLRSLSRLIEDLVAESALSTDGTEETYIDKNPVNGSPSTPEGATAPIDIEAIKAERKNCIDEYEKDLTNPLDSCGWSLPKGFSCNRCGAMFETIISDGKFCPACQSTDLTPHGMMEHRLAEMDNSISQKVRALRAIEERKLEINSMKEGRKKQNALKKLNQMEEDFQDTYVLMRPTREFRESMARAEEERKKAQPSSAIVEEPELASGEGTVPSTAHEKTLKEMLAENPYPQNSPEAWKWIEDNDARFTEQVRKEHPIMCSQTVGYKEK